MNNHIKKDHQVASGKNKKKLIPKEPFICHPLQWYHCLFSHPFPLVYVDSAKWVSPSNPYIGEVNVGSKITLTSKWFTTPRIRSAVSVLSRWAGCTSDTPLDKVWDRSLGLRSRQSRELPVDGKKLDIRWPINKKKWTGAKKLLAQRVSKRSNFAKALLSA